MQKRSENWLKTLLFVSLVSLCASALAEPMGYSINSDSGSNDAEGLYEIDLATGAESRIGTVKPIVGLPYIDVEGLAFAPDGTLYGVDDEALRLFPIATDTAFVQEADDVPISGLPLGGNNDFGMTFACDGTLYITSVANRTLYQLELDGTATKVGNEGALGRRISALAAYGNPVRLYGLGNGIDKEGNTDSPSLYEINPSTGVATEIGPLGAAVGKYNEAGLAFDDAGQLWAITDRRQLLFPSQVMRVNRTTGEASEVKNTSEQGFESLAITVPRGCEAVGSGEHAAFDVQKRFVNGENDTPVDLHISCRTGLPLDQSLTVIPNEGGFGNVEVRFIVEEFIDGTLDCDVWEDTPHGYVAEYDCQAPNGLLLDKRWRGALHLR